MSWWRKVYFYFLPLLHVHIRLPFIEVRTTLCGSLYELGGMCYEFNYAAWYFRLLCWSVELNLYDTHRRMVMRRERKKWL